MSASAVSVPKVSGSSKVSASASGSGSKMVTPVKNATVSKTPAAPVKAPAAVAPVEVEDAAPAPVVALADTFTFDSIISCLKSATPEQAADILAALDRGMALWAERKGVSEKVEKVVKVEKKKAGRPKKVVTAPAAVADGADGAPDADAYRMAAASIDMSVCVARTLSGKDARWSPAVYHEGQCGSEVAEGSDLCARCHKRFETFAETGKQKDWNGRITEDPHAAVHMIGTVWAEKCKYGSSASSSASVASSDSGGADEKMTKKEAAAEKKAAKEKEKAAKEAEKAEKKVAKELEKAEKAAAKASASKEKAKAPKKEKAPAKAKASASSGEGEEVVPAKADASEATVAEGTLSMIAGDLRMVKNGNVYEYDEITETAGDFLGRLGADGDSIDTDAAEEGAAESESE